MGSKRIALRLSARLLQEIDVAAKQNLNSRSSFIRESIIMRLNDQHLVPNPRVDDTLELLRRAGRHNGG